jgi:hypothetical protein
MRLFSYRVVADTGFAPNPFRGICTLATCKPVIRRVAQPGDWVLGTGSVALSCPDRIIFVLLVDEVIPLLDYGSDTRFAAKRPDLDGNWLEQRLGFHGPRQADHDLGGENALIGREFYYFGRAAPELPTRFHGLICRGRGHRSRFDPDLVAAFVPWLRSAHSPGRHGLPHEAPPDACSPPTPRPAGSGCA